MNNNKIIGISFESLDLNKPLEKMTSKELRQLCMEKIPQIQGASSMAKETLITNIKNTFGIKDEEGVVNPYKDQIHTIKRTIRELRIKKIAITSRKDKEIMRRKINKLKKRTRRLASAA